jgi:molybdopterin molybdotransferase
MKDLAQALALVLDGLEPLPGERVAVEHAYGRVAAAPVGSAVDLPPFDRSAMDGFAVRAADVAAGTPLRVLGDAAAGGEQGAAVGAGTAVRISTGAAIPAGADAVLRVEDAETHDGVVVPTADVAVGLHVRRRGEDLHEGDVLVRPGERLTLPRLSSIASAGVGEVAVHRAPQLHLLVTGSELLPPGAPPEPGKIHESNGLMVRLLAARAGAEIVDHGVIGDDAAATRATVEAGLEGDVLVVSGGVSVGPHDHVKPAFEAAGVEEVFWRVRIKPGKPLWFGRRGRTLVFGLPGNPLSAIVGTAGFIVPALRRLQGERDAGPGFVRGRLGVPAGPSDNRTTFLSARFERAADGVLEAFPTERQGSHMTGALGESDGFAVAPHDAGPLAAGAAVDLLRLDQLCQ